MEHQAKKFIRWVVIIIYGFMGIIIATNYFIDPFEVTGSGLLPPVQNFINQRVYKLRVIDEKHADYNGYILGSSRAQNIHPEQLRHYLPDSHFYNFSFTKGTLAERTLLLSYILKNNYSVKYLLIELDIPDLYDQHLADADLSSRPMTFLPPRVVDDIKYALQYYKLYYAQLMFEQLWYKWSHRHLPLPPIFFDTTGVANWTKDERQIKEDPEKFIRDHFPQARLNARFRGRTEDLVEGLQSVSDMVDICHQYSIDCIFFTPPINQHNLDMWHLDYVLGYLKGVAEFTDFWSFSDYNSITLDDHNYVDDVHYRAKVIPFILARIFHDRSVDVPSDFGVPVTKGNYPIYAKRVRDGFEARDAAVPPPNGNIPPNTASKAQ